MGGVSKCLNLSYIPIYIIYCIVSKVQKEVLALKGKVSHNLSMNPTLMNDHKFTTHCKEPILKIRKQIFPGIVRPQSQFPHSCVCERFIYSHDRSAYSAAGNMWSGPILGSYKSLTGTCIWKLGLRPRNSQKINTYSKWDFRCSVDGMYVAVKYCSNISLIFVKQCFLQA
jgi:hypothetical protein